MTAATATDREMLKSLVLEVLKEEPTILKAIVKEVLEENHIIVSTEQGARRKYIEALVREDFEKYATVFKALA